MNYLKIDKHFIYFSFFKKKRRSIWQKNRRQKEIAIA